jgi:magnesium transporter
MAQNQLQTELLYPELLNALETGDSEELEAICATLAEEDLGEMIRRLPEDARAQFFEKVPVEKATEIFAMLEVGQQREIFDAIGNHRVAAILNEMDPDDRTALLETLPENLMRQLLSFLLPPERKLAQSLLNFPKDSIGRLMTPDFLAIRQEWTVERVLDFIRRNGEDKETLNDLYVVDEKGHLVDDVEIRRFLLSPLSRKTSEIMDRQFMALSANAPEEEAIQAFKKYSTRTALPVTDDEGFLLGIITIDDILHLAEKETTEDIHKLGGVGAFEEPYLSAPLWYTVRKRVGWLIILFVGGMLTASAMGMYEAEIEKAVILSFFIPLIIASGGNSGSQAASLVIRAIALGEVRFQDGWKLLRREIVAGLILGCALGAIGFLRVALGPWLGEGFGEHWVPLAFTVSFALVGIVAWGTLIGALFPVLLKRLGLDPATSSSPLVATFIDVTGILLYFNIAMWLLKGKML